MDKCVDSNLAEYALFVAFICILLYFVIIFMPTEKPEDKDKDNDPYY